MVPNETVIAGIFGPYLDRHCKLVPLYFSEFFSPIHYPYHIVPQPIYKIRLQHIEKLLLAHPWQPVILTNDQNSKPGRHDIEIKMLYLTSKLNL